MLTIRPCKIRIFSPNWTSMALLISHHAFLVLSSAEAQNPVYPCTFSRTRIFPAPRKWETTHFAFQTCTTKNDPILGQKTTQLVGMVGFSTLAKFEDGQPKIRGRKEAEATAA